MSTWPKNFVVSLPIWPTAKAAALKLQLEPEAEIKLRSELQRIVVTLEIAQSGRARLVV